MTGRTGKGGKGPDTVPGTLITYHVTTGRPRRNNLIKKVVEVCVLPLQKDLSGRMHD